MPHYSYSNLTYFFDTSASVRALVCRLVRDDCHVTVGLHLHVLNLGRFELERSRLHVSLELRPFSRVILKVLLRTPSFELILLL